MKKIFLLSMLVLAFAATAYSQDVKLDFRASGFIDMRTGMYRNINWENQITGARSGFFDVLGPESKPGTGPHGSNGGEWNKTASWIENRARLKFDAVMGKELSGTFFFEFDSRTWGDFPTSGATQPEGRNQIGFWSADRAGLEVKNIYFDVAVPYIPIPVTVRVGLQPIAIRTGVFMYVDGEGITAAAKLDPVTIIGIYSKVFEGRIAASDDIDIWALHVNAKLDKVTVGGYALYQNARSYPMNATSATSQTVYGISDDSMKSQMWWLGAYMDGRVGPVDVNFDFSYDTGDVQKKFETDPTIPDKVKYNGWMAKLKIDFPWEAFNFGTVWSYGSGADARRTDKFGLPNNKVADPASAAAGVYSDKMGSYAVPIESEAQAGDSEVLYGSVVNGGFTGVLYGGDGYKMFRGPLGGQWFGKLYASYKATPDIKLTLQGLYIGDTTKNGDTIGTSRNITGETLKNNSTIGWEMDIIGEWQIYKNLNFKASFGYLWGGDAIKFWNPATGTNEKPKDPWVFFTNLNYSF